MNSISFYINSNGDIIKCECTENNNNYKQTTIDLPQQRIQEIFFSLINNYKKNEINLKNNNLNIITFNNIKQEALYKIIQENNYYKDLINNNNKNNNHSPKKVIRKNILTKKIIITSAIITGLLIIYAISNGVQGKNNQKHTQTEKESTIEETTDNHNTQDDNDLIYQTISNHKSDPFEENSSNINYGQNTNDSQNINKDTPDNVITLNTEDWTETEKYLNTKSCYFEIISKTAKTYGIDPILALALCTHERGVHSDTVDPGGAIGLFQIQVEGKWNWCGKEITAYNFDTNSYETVTVTKEMVSDIYGNSKIGCMAIQNVFTSNNYNILQALTEYNYGIKNLQYVLETCAAETGFKLEELNDMNNLEWLKYRDIIFGGDPEYIENVFKYIPNEAILTFTKPNGEQITIKYTNSNQKDFHK